jgi:hypothetical protein
MSPLARKGGLMARLNIEDQFWLDAMTVVATVGDVDRVVGNAVRFFRFAQEKHKAGKLITEDEFKANNFLESLIPTFATRTTQGIKAAGADKHFSWLLDKKEAGKLGGQRSAAARKEKYGSSAPKQHEADPEATRSTRSTSKQIEPSPSSSSSSSSSFSFSNSFSSSFSKGVQASDDAGPTPDELLDLWNENCGPLPKAQKLTNVRKKSAKARLHEKPDLEYWKSVIKTLATSPFTSGTNDRGWLANIDFMLRPDTHVKVSEGAYTARKGVSLRVMPNSTNQHIWDELEALEQKPQKEREVGNESR